MEVGNFNVGLGVRKAKKFGASTPEAEPVAPAVSVAATLPNITVSEAINQAASLNGVGATVATSPTLSAQDIINLAAKHGLTLQAPKREFIKHTYSVTTDSKALFKKYCDTLGINMQDAMEEALQGFFKKHALEYTRIKEAKNK